MYLKTLFLIHLIGFIDTAFGEQKVHYEFKEFDFKETSKNVSKDKNAKNQ